MRKIFEYTNFGEEITSSNILNYIGQKMDICAITGLTGTVAIPIDGNQDNILPTNMGRVHRSVFEKDTTMTFYKKEFEVDKVLISISFFVPKFWVSKVKESYLEKITNINSNVLARPIELVDLPYVLWDEYAMDHVKGVFSIEVKETSTKESFLIESPMAVDKMLHVKHTSSESVSNVLNLRG